MDEKPKAKRSAVEDSWLLSVLMNLEDGIISTDRDGVVNFLNPAAEALLGRSRDSALGHRLEEVLALIAEKTGLPVLVTIDKIVEQAPPVPEEREVNLVRGGERIPVEFGAALIRDGRGQIAGSVLSVRDITQRKIQEHQLAYLAIHDPQTGLPNRTLFNDRLSLALAAASRYKQKLAVLLLDIDHFKQVNETHGPAFADTLVVKAARRLVAMMRKSDTVARPESDEFLLLLPGITDTEGTGRIALRIQDSFLNPFELGSERITISVSIGIAIFPQDGQDVDTLVRRAELALRAAKDAGRDTFRLYHAIAPQDRSG
ncbi:MAG: sensor domain-containing diguanylate cyclase [Candidatus Aminicenantes bacterium]|nr:sensor domain-containing diguanylate cyclase [Candidatus Aminicenantes bacterium]